jgi:hypothetical protein
MASFKTMDDIDREKHKENREKMRLEVTEDVNNILGGIFGRPRSKRYKRSLLDWIFFILKVIGIILSIIIIADVILGSVWLLKFFLKSLFGIG